MEKTRISKALLILLLMLLLIPVSAVSAKPSLSKTKLSLYAGRSATLTAKGFSGAVTWKSSDKAVATVSKKGLVKAKKKGTAKITVTTHNKKTATCTITVKPAATNAVLNGGASLVIGEKMTVAVPVAFEPADAYANFIWSTYDDTIATVDADGVVRGIAEGEAVITATAQSGVSTECVVEVFTR